MKQNKLKFEFPLKSVKYQGRNMALGWWQSRTNLLFKQQFFFHCGFGKQLVTNTHESPKSHPQTPLFPKIIQKGCTERFVLIWMCWQWNLGGRGRLKASLDYTASPLLSGGMGAVPPKQLSFKTVRINLGSVSLKQ